MNATADYRCTSDSSDGKEGDLGNNPEYAVQYGLRQNFLAKQKQVCFLCSLIDLSRRSGEEHEG
jgi:hypothetical protein